MSAGASSAATAPARPRCYTWTVISGSLPDGLSLASNGVISGTPTAGSTKNFTVQVESGDGQTDTAGLSIHIGNEILAGTTVDEPSAVTYSQTMAYPFSPSSLKAQVR